MTIDWGARAVSADKATLAMLGHRTRETVALVLALLVGGFAARPASAQQSVYVAAGAGYSISPGGTSPGLTTVNAGATVMLTPTLGISFGVSLAPGERPVRSPAGSADLFPSFVGDQRTLSLGDFIHQRVTLRYAKPLAGRVGFMIGAGIGTVQFDTVLLRATSLSEVTEVEHRQRWTTVAFEALARVRVSPRVSIATGFIADTTLDEWYRQPVILLAIGL